MIKNDDKKQQALLRAGLRLFASRGFDGASTREIASAAKANIGLIAYYFGSKEGLFDEAVNRWSAELLRRLEQEPRDLQSVITRFLQFSVVDSQEGAVVVTRESIAGEASRITKVVNDALRPVITFLDDQKSGLSGADMITILLAVSVAAGGMPSLAPVTARTEELERARRWAHALLNAGEVEVSKPSGDSAALTAYRGHTDPDFLD